MTKKTRIDIAACTDRQFVMPTGVMMQSVCVNNPDVDIVFHIIVDDDVTDDDKRDLEDVAAPFSGKSVVFYRASDYIRNIDFPNLENSPVTRVSFYRLWLVEILPEVIDKVIYLDGDVIVRHSLLPLWNTDIDGYAVAAVPDALEVNLALCERLGYSPTLGYFNSGVLVVNLKYWREHKVLAVFVEYIKTHFGAIRLWDQDVLNVVFKEKKKWLPIRYNLMNAFLWEDILYDSVEYGHEVQDARKDPDCIHFTPSKPWYAYQREPHPFRNTFLKYQTQTKWRGVTTDHRPLRLRIINLVADWLRKVGLKSRIKRQYIPISPID